MTFEYSFSQGGRWPKTHGLLIRKLLSALLKFSLRGKAKSSRGHGIRHHEIVFDVTGIKIPALSMARV